MTAGSYDCRSSLLFRVGAFGPLVAVASGRLIRPVDMLALALSWVECQIYGQEHFL